MIGIVLTGQEYSIERSSEQRIFWSSQCVLVIKKQVINQSKMAKGMAFAFPCFLIEWPWCMIFCRIMSLRLLKHAEMDISRLYGCCWNGACVWIAKMRYFAALYWSLLYFPNRAANSSPVGIHRFNVRGRVRQCTGFTLAARPRCMCLHWQKGNNLFSVHFHKIHIKFTLLITR